MNMMKWFISFVLSLGLLVGCNQSEVKPEQKAASKQTEQKEKAKQEDKKNENKQEESQKTEEQKQPEEQKQTEEQLKDNQEQKPQEKAEVKQEEKKEQEPASEPKQLEQPKGKEEKAEQKQSEQPAVKEDTKVVNQPKETPKQEQSVPHPVVPKPEPTPIPTPQAKQVTISVRGDQGYLLDAKKVDIQEGTTVFEVLKNTGLEIDSTGSGNSKYVKGINDLYEFDKGSTSGWKYRVNGTFPNRSAGAVTVKPGDKIEWVYVLN